MIRRKGYSFLYLSSYQLILTKRKWLKGEKRVVAVLKGHNMKGWQNKKLQSQVKGGISLSFWKNIIFFRKNSFANSVSEVWKKNLLVWYVFVKKLLLPFCEDFQIMFFKFSKAQKLDLEIFTCKQACFRQGVWWH